MSKKGYLSQTLQIANGGPKQPDELAAVHDVCDAHPGDCDRLLDWRQALYCGE